MINEDRYCNDILIQLAALDHSIKSLSNLILENHLYSCISRDLDNGKLEAFGEIVSLFRRFNK